MPSFSYLRVRISTLMYIINVFIGKQAHTWSIQKKPPKNDSKIVRYATRSRLVVTSFSLKLVWKLDGCKFWRLEVRRPGDFQTSGTYPSLDSSIGSTFGWYHGGRGFKSRQGTLKVVLGLLGKLDHNQSIR